MVVSSSEGSGSGGGRRALFAAGLLLILACGDDDAPPPDAALDAPADAPPDVMELPDAPEDAYVPPPPRYLRFVRVMMEGEPAQITDFRFIPNDEGAPTDELLATTRDGRLLHYEIVDGRALMRGELAIPDVFVNLDCGLISLTFAPDFQATGHVYLGQCFSRFESGVVRIEFAPPDYALVDDPVEVLRYGSEDAIYPWHNVGSIGFDGDVLWALFGDKTRPETAQDPGDPLGSVIRVVPRADGSYEPAPGNPHALGDERFHPDVYAYGLRSPWKGVLSEGRFYVGDVGNFRVEEVNVIDQAGGFLGWPRAEGPCGAACDEITDPIVDPVTHWTHRADHPFLADDPFAIARTGRVAYVGLRYPAADDDDDPYEGFLDGAVLYGDACVGFVRALEVDDEGALVRDEGVGHLVGASGWQIAADGHIYATSFGRCTAVRDAVYLPGGFWRAELSERPMGVERTEGFPERLSEYGLFPEAPVLDNVPTGAQPFEPTYPMWTNGMGKLRHVVLDAGGEIRRVGGSYVLPNGTLFFKTFLADAPEGTSGYPVETRVIRIAEEGELEYAAYLWNADGTDAERLDLLTPEPVEIEVFGEPITHEVPSRIQCVACHEAGARRILGFTPLQIEDGLEGVDDPELREVLGWVYGNCTHCHDGSGGPDASFSMLPGVFLDNTIDHPTEGSASGVGIRIVPGDPDASALVIALSGGDDVSGVRPMPPLGVQRRDDEALARLRAWIATLP